MCKPNVSSVLLRHAAVAHGENSKIEVIPADRRHGAQISRFKASFAYCASRRRVFGTALVTVACHFPLGYFFLLFVPLGGCPPPPLLPPPYLLRPQTCTYAPRRVDYSSSPISLERATYSGIAWSLVHEARSIILDHAYRIAAAHSASPDHPRAILGHSRDFHSSGERSVRAPRTSRSWIS